MEELLKIYLPAIFIIAPIYVVIIRILFKKSFLAKLGYSLIVLVIVSTLTTLTVEKLQLPRIIGIILRITYVLLTLIYLRSEIKILKDLTQILDKISNLDLTTDINPGFTKRKDEFGDLARSLERMKKKLFDIISRLQNSIFELTNTSANLSAVSQQVAQNSSEQSASTEEISAALEQILASVQSNSENVHAANQHARKTAESIDKNRHVIFNALESIKKINEIITNISEIAKRTDILSINAGIEAAKGEQAGKGFAVIAREIRKLSETTQQLVSQILNMVEDNINTSNEAIDKLKRIIPEFIIITKNINNIAIATKEQEPVYRKLTMLCYN